MATENVTENQAWRVETLCDDILAYQDPGDYIHLVISDAETGEVFGCSEFMIIKNGKNLIFSGIRFKSKEPT